MKKLNLQKARVLLNDFSFERLFIDVLGWNNPAGIDAIETKRACKDKEKKQLEYKFQTIAELSGAKIFQVWKSDSNAEAFNASQRTNIAEDLTKVSAESVAIFLDNKENPTVSTWVWRKKLENNKFSRREHFYVKGQPGDLFITKIRGLFFDFNQDLPSISAVADAFEKALDVEQVTKKFFKSYQEKFEEFSMLIEGFEKDDERRWYASVLLNRLMFIYFLQKKGFVDAGDTDYLTKKLQQSKSKLGQDQYYSQFLQQLFFEGFAKPEGDRTAETNALLGKIKYLNGGLFMPHKFENKELYPNVRIPDRAFDLLIGDAPKGLFNQYSWSLNDIPGEPDNEINPDVLGYIFEKYINQKQFGAYYTKPEITEYLCTQTVNRLILDKLNDSKDSELVLALKGKTYHFENIGELYQKMDDAIIKRLVLGKDAILKKLSLLDPACGSGAFLVSAMKVLVDLYSVIYGKVKFSLDKDLKAYFQQIEAKHASTAYYIKKVIIAHNLYGVDIMEEATEIAKLRLFLALVSSATKIDELEPLPNIDFNIMCGNSLIGQLGIDTSKFTEEFKKNQKAISVTKSSKLATGVPAHQTQMFAPTSVQTQMFTVEGDVAQSVIIYEEIIAEKERLIQLYKQTEKDNVPAALIELKAKIESHREESNAILNNQLKLQMDGFKIVYEKQTWDAKKGKLGKAEKLPLKESHIAALQPFHWGYEFSHIMRNGGFDAIITNPPWEILKPQNKEFLAKYSNVITKNKMSVLDFDEEHVRLMANEDIKEAYLDYQSGFPYQSEWYRNAPQYKNQSTLINGKKTGTDINLFKLFTEQCYNLLKANGYCGIVIPSGIYTDLGATGLRKLLMDNTHITGLFCFENRKTIFEGVDSRFKFVVLSFEKGGHTEAFPAAFMRHEVGELAQFPREGSMKITRDFILRQSPDSQSIMELKNELELQIAEKMLLFPKLGSEEWGVKLSTEFHMTNDKYLFKTKSGEGRLPLFQGGMMHQFTHAWGMPQYWIDEKEGRAALLGRLKDEEQSLDYEHYRLVYREIASSTNERGMITTVLPKKVFFNHKLQYVSPNSSRITIAGTLFLCALANSYPFDFYLRIRVSSTISMFQVYVSCAPVFNNEVHQRIVEITARLICTTTEYAELWEEVMGSPWDASLAAHEDVERNTLRAELDGIIAHIYGMTEEEFAYILSTFPIVPQAQRDAALAAFRADS